MHPEKAEMLPIRVARVLHMPLPVSVLPIEDRSALAVALDELVEEYGWSAVKLAVQQIEAANGGVA